MKQSEKSIIFGGIVLLFLAAFFTISIMVQFLNYGVTKEISALFTIGGILLSAYGYSAILVCLQRTRAGRYFRSISAFRWPRFCRGESDRWSF